MSFSDIIGNEHIKRYFTTSIANKTLSHAHIILGNPGCGKALLADAAAKALLCEKGGGEACGACLSCKTFDTGNNLDVLHIIPTVKTGINATISVDDIRDNVCEPLTFKPFRRPLKVFVIKNGDIMNISAQNALLKALEEPPDYGVFLVTATNKERILPTILSRAVTIKINPLPDHIIRAYLTDKKGFTEDEAIAAITCAGGSIGESLSIKNDAGFTFVIDRAADIVSGGYNNTAEIITAVKSLDAAKARMGEILSVSLLIYRDIIVYKACGDDTTIAWKRFLPLIRTIAAKSSPDNLQQRFDALLRTKDYLTKNANYTMAMENLLLDLIS